VSPLFKSDLFRLKDLFKASNWILGLQWLVFLFTNIVVIPISVGAAFGLEQGKIASLLQSSFVVTGLACMMQALFGHRRAIMEGQSGLWWGVILSLCSTASAQGVSLETLGGSLGVGIVISGTLTLLIGLSGLGYHLARLFNPAVMGVFMFLLGCQLAGIFLKGMLGIPFGHAPAGEASESVQIDVAVSLLSLVVVIGVILINIKTPPRIGRYALLIGMIAGWALFVQIFQSDEAVGPFPPFRMQPFPFGAPAWDAGIIVTAVLAGLLNLANTFGALKGTEEMYRSETGPAAYRASLSITGAFVVLSGLLGLVPYAPYVSSIGFLHQVGVLRRLPFILGSFMFIVMGIVPWLGQWLTRLPLSVGSAVLFVAYLQLLLSSWNFFRQVEWNTANIYRSAIPLFVGIVIMTMPASYFEPLPALVRPLVSNGLLMGILLALLLENLCRWDRIAPKA